MTLPNHQRKGYGHFLIDFSYLLSRKEGKRCSPEKPLSDLGLISYSSYWCYRVMHYLDLHQTEALSVEAISNATGMTINDVLAVLEHYGAIRWNPSRTIYEASLDASVLSNFREKAASKTYLGADSKYLRWVPLTSTR